MPFDGQEYADLAVLRMARVAEPGAWFKGGLRSGDGRFCAIGFEIHPMDYGRRARC